MTLSQSSVKGAMLEDLGVCERKGSQHTVCAKILFVSSYLANFMFEGSREERAAAALAEYLSPEQAGEWGELHQSAWGDVDHTSLWRRPYTFRILTVGEEKTHLFQILKYYRFGRFDLVLLRIDGRERCFSADQRFPADDQVLAIKMMVEQNPDWVLERAG